MMKLAKNMLKIEIFNGPLIKLYNINCFRCMNWCGWTYYGDEDGVLLSKYGYRRSCLAGSISDIENGYLLLSDLGLRALLSLYCVKGKDFDQFVFKNEIKELGFNKFFAHKVFI